MTIDAARIEPDVEGMKAWRHAIHRHPELGFEEHATSALVAERLRAWGYEVHTGIAVTGVVGVLRVGDGSGRTIGLRADMDAIPVQEMTGLPWASTVPGKMHGCGHDGHTAMLLGAAELLAKQVKGGQFRGNGTVVLIFQPAEELGGGGGARRMIEEGLFERFPCDAIFGMHNFPGIPVGQVHVRPGAFMASSDKVLIRFVGRGGHGGMPHMAVDPTLPAAATVLGLVSTALDYHRFCLMLANGGELDGVRLLGRKTIDLMTMNHLPGRSDLSTLSQSLFSETQNGGVGFGLGFAVTQDVARTMIPGSAGEFYWGGMFSTSFFIDPVEKLHLVFMTQLSPSLLYPIRRELKTLIYSALT